MVFHYEDIFSLIGDLGPFQMCLVVLLCLPAIPVAIQTYLPMFTLFVPRHRCRLPSQVFANDTYEETGDEHSSYIRSLIPKSEDGTMQECCIANGTASAEEKERLVLCHDFVYDDSVMTLSATGEWGLVCSSRDAVPTSQCVMWVGVMFGAVVFGVVADKFGRTVAVKAAVGFNLATSAVLAASPDFPVFVVILFFNGSTFSGMLTSTLVLAVEHVGPSKRHLVSIVNHACVAIGTFVLAALSLSLREWRLLQLSAAACTLPFIIFFIPRFLPESPRWLFAKHRIDQLMKILKMAAKRNGVDFEEFRTTVAEMDDASISIVHAQPETGRFRDIFSFRRPNFLCKTIIIFLNWFIITLLYYGLTMTAGKVSPSLQLNLSISGGVELSAYVFCGVTMSRFGRRNLLVFSHTVAGAALLLTICTKTEEKVADNAPLIGLMMVGKWAASISFTVICIYSAEIFPTVVRNLGVGLSSCCGRLGGILAPVIADLGREMNTVFNVCEDKIGGKDAQWPLLLCGGLAIFIGILTLFLPETLNQPLPETCEDAEQIGVILCFKGRVSGETFDHELKRGPINVRAKFLSTLDTTYGSIPTLAPNKGALLMETGDVIRRDPGEIRDHYCRLPSHSLIFSSS